MDPAFINETKFSFLQKVKEASFLLNNEGEQGRAVFVLPWAIHPDDDLAKLKLIDNNVSHFKLDLLFVSKRASRVAKLREKLKKHIDIQSDKELGQISMKQVEFL